MGAEAIFAVFIEVVTGGAPQEAVVAALRRAAVILSAHEQEGELAELSVGVAIFHLHHCRKGSTINDLFSNKCTSSKEEKGLSLTLKDKQNIFSSLLLSAAVCTRVCKVTTKVVLSLDT